MHIKSDGRNASISSRNLQLPVRWILLEDGTMPRIPLIEDLTSGPVPSGSNLMVEYDPASQWYNASLSMAAGWLREGGLVGYNTHAQPPADIRTQLSHLGLDVPKLEENGKLLIFDGYTVTLGQKSKEKYAFESLKIADLSIWFARDYLRASPTPDLLIIVDNGSVLCRYNDEKAFVEFVITRAIPSARARKSTIIAGFAKGVLSDWVYRQLEAAHDGIVDFKLDETGQETVDLTRIRSFRNVGYDRTWHRLRIADNFEVTLEK